MSNKIKVTFKKDARETGLRAVGNPYPNVKVKLNGKEVGVIYAPNWHTNGWGLALAFKADNAADFEWKFYKKTATEQEARDQAVRVVPAVVDQLHIFED